jgi:hypothetical protein
MEEVSAKPIGFAMQEHLPARPADVQKFQGLAILAAPGTPEFAIHGKLVQRVNVLLAHSPFPLYPDDFVGLGSHPPTGNIDASVNLA